ncbi:MAG: hypothetical protein IPM29_13745 [Planctomycetes bacterium]|nr:hypothetical protein [Planctomycetota bacterium]
MAHHDDLQHADRDDQRRPAPALRGLLCCLTALSLAVGGCSGGGGTDDPGGSGGGGGGGGGDPGGGGGGQSGGSGQPLQISPRLVVRNEHDEDRTDTIEASVPFPEGMIADLSGVGVSGLATAWMPMQVWPDGSVRIAQAQFTDDIPANGRKVYDVVQGVSPLTGPFEPNGWISIMPERLRAKARVTDVGDHAYEVETELLGGRVVHETPLVRTWHQRLYHQPTEAGCIQRDFLTSQFYVTEYRDIPLVTVDWIIGNDYLGSDDPQGSTDPNLYPLSDVDVNEVTVMFDGFTEIQPYEPQWHDIEAPRPVGDFTAFTVMRDDFIGDGQTRRYRFQIRVEPANAPVEAAQRWQRSFRARLREPIFALADVPTWQLTHALGVHGGPADPPANAAERARGDYLTWLGRDHFGTWGCFGDVDITGTAGTPRNAPVNPDAAHAIQAESQDLMVKLQHMAWMQGIRPFHLWGLEIGANEDLLLYYPIPYRPTDPSISRITLGRREVLDNDPYPQMRTRTNWRNHGVNGYDEEHWTTDILFDYWTLTGDHWAQAELRNLGESLQGMLRLRGYATENMRAARSEGWCMVGFVQAYLATQDESTKDYACRRIREIVEVQRWKDHPSRTLREYPGHPGTGFGVEVSYFPPWEHASVMLGYLDAWKFFGCEEARQIAQDVVRTIDYAWVSDYTHPVTHQYYADAIRYWCPLQQAGQPRPPDFLDQTVGAYIPSTPLGSVNLFFITPLELMTRMTDDPYTHERAVWQLTKIMPGNDDDRNWDKWSIVAPRFYSARPPQ